jgi:predicted translin family RNA/ssDNA-binding protein
MAYRIERIVIGIKVINYFQKLPLYIMKLKLTIKKFQELFAISQMETDEITKSSLLVQCLTDKTEAEIDRMKPEQFGKLCKQVNDAFDIVGKKIENSKPTNYVRANGNWYFMNYDIAKPPMNAGRYVEMATFSNDIIGNLHLIMATMANPMEWSLKGLRLKKYDAINHDKVAEDMLHLDFEVAYHSAVFFYAVFSKSIQSFQNYFKSITKNQTELEAAMENFTRISGGYTTAKWYQNLKISV